ncbi:ABC transporter permease [Nocardia yamanashiensis]|uniref:ABC transporter permease n=1 Tax=Nocardia yamanashiensis TaxID=209247 RepID=UPI001E3415E8|nr:ABC transporter permease [Nocardia yamanashiensis]UGT40683.1 ABC transporter permease [Nocardia yamanashiensis]
MSTLTTTFADSATMLRRNIVHAKRYPSMTLQLVLMPVVMLLLFNYVFGGALKGATGGGKYIDYLTPGMMLIIPAYMIAGVAVSVSTDMTKGIVNRFRTMHITQSSMLTGEVIGSVIQGLLGIIGMVLVALAVGFRPNANPVEWLAVFGLMALVIFALNWLGAAFGVIAQNPENASNMPMPIMLLPFLGSGLVPTDTMPSGVRQFAEYQPFTPITETVRGLLMGTEIGHNGVLAIGWCVVIAAGGYFWSTSVFRRKTN